MKQPPDFAKQANGREGDGSQGATGQWGISRPSAKLATAYEVCEGMVREPCERTRVFLGGHEGKDEGMMESSEEWAHLAKAVKGAMEALKL